MTWYCRVFHQHSEHGKSEACRECRYNPRNDDRYSKER